MIGRETFPDSSRDAIGWSALLAISAVATMFPWAIYAQSSSEPTSSNEESSAPTAHTHMSEELRSSIKKIAIIAGGSPVNEEITGSYEETTK